VPTNVLKEKTQYKKDLVHHQNNQGPGVIQCTAVVSMVKDKVAICGKTYELVTKIKISSVIHSGFSITNQIAVGQELTVAFMKYQIEAKDKIKQIFKADQEVALQLSESLCPDMSSTMYKIIGYTIE